MQKFQRFVPLTPALVPKPEHEYHPFSSILVKSIAEFQQLVRRTLTSFPNQFEIESKKNETFIRIENGQIGLLPLSFQNMIRVIFIELSVRKTSSLICKQPRHPPAIFSKLLN